MKIFLEKEDFDAIASSVAVQLQPLLKASNSHTPNPIMNVTELAEYLRVTTSWVYKQVQFKTIPHFHAGRYPRFRKKDIDTWIESQSVPDTAPAYPRMKAVK
jgi:excisionase family DNA binding protein